MIFMNNCPFMALYLQQPAVCHTHPSLSTLLTLTYIACLFRYLFVVAELCLHLLESFPEPRHQLTVSIPLRLKITDLLLQLNYLSHQLLNQCIPARGQRTKQYRKIGHYITQIKSVQRSPLRRFILELTSHPSWGAGVESRILQ